MNRVPWPSVNIEPEAKFSPVVSFIRRALTEVPDQNKQETIHNFFFPLSGHLTKVFADEFGLHLKLVQSRLLSTFGLVEEAIEVANECSTEAGKILQPKDQQVFKNNVATQLAMLDELY